MKKLLLLFTALLPLVVFATTNSYSHSEETNTFSADTAIWLNNKKLEIKEDSVGLRVKVYNESGTQLKLLSETVYSDSSKVTKWEVKEFLNLPFADKFSKRKKNRRKFSANWAGVGFGFVNACDKDLKFINSEESNGISIDFNRSKEIFWNIFDVSVPLYSNNFGLVFGFGLDWRNYVLEGNKHFYRENHKIAIETLSENYDIKKSRIKTFDLVVPVMFEWQLHPKECLYLQAGAQVNFTTHSSMKTTYHAAADPQYSRNTENMDDIGVNPISIDLVARAGYGSIGFYAKYSPNKMFQSNKGPEMRSFSTGIILTY